MKLTNGMTLPIFYAPLIDTDPVLPEEESAHCTKVLRLGRGASSCRHFMICITVGCCRADLRCSAWAGRS